MNGVRKSALVLLLILTWGPVALAQMNKVIIKVDGLACPF